jgi:hypothetical protein
MSFNGGAGGVAAKPTNEELLADRESHIPATRPQADHARAASMRSEQFQSTNNGKPAIAATERPGEYKGKGVVSATAAGKSVQSVPAPARTAQPESRQSPPGGQPNKPEAVPNAPRIEERPPAIERPVRPELSPAQPPPGFQQRPPAVERPVPPGPPNNMQRFERPPGAQPRPPQPEQRRPEAKECGRPGLPPCPR